MRFGDATVARPLTGIPNLGGKVPSPKVSNSSTTGSPVGGINARDSIANMDPTDAVSLINFFPGTLGCVVRNGYQISTYGYPGPVETISSYPLLGGTEYLLAFSSGNMYNASGSGLAQFPLVTGLQNSRWQSADYPTTSGVYWIGVNGADNPIILSQQGPSAVLNRLVAGNGTDPYTISGVNPATFTSIAVHQKRLWFTTINSTTLWYLPPGQMWGVATMFDFGPLWRKGGYAMTPFTWTVDAGDGPNDRFCCISSAGEVTVYAGTDPSQESTWSLDGVFFIGRPVGIRCVTKFGGDVAILCDHGLASMNSVLTSTTINSRTTFFTDKIMWLISQEIQNWSTQFGWQPYVHPMKNMMIINVPDATQPNGYQLVMNTITGAWTSFEGYKAVNWVNYGGEIYFGGSDGTVCHALYGFLDGFDPNRNIDGIDIKCEVITAFNYFTLPGTEKNFTMVRPNLIGINKPSLAVQANMQFNMTDPPPVVPAPDVDFPQWDEAVWDSNLWAGNTTTFADWYGILGIGYAAALAMRLSAKDQVSWASTDWVFQVQKGTAI